MRSRSAQEYDVQTPIEKLLGDALMARGWTLALAESCTGGLVSHRITNIPGSSRYFLGSVVAYSNQAKMRLLHVQQSTLLQHGAVSKETALEMAAGASDALGADLGVAVTGIAGPAGGSVEKPVGTTWVAVCSPRGEIATWYCWHGDRATNKDLSAQSALALALQHLQSTEEE
jgi:PncC family amidohydrolase